MSCKSSWVISGINNNNNNNNKNGSEIWGSDGGKDVNHGLLGCGALVLYMVTDEEVPPKCWYPSTRIHNF
jgi:hypothetical protein